MRDRGERLSREIEWGQIGEKEEETGGEKEGKRQRRSAKGKRQRERERLDKEKKNTKIQWG
jgi:hypothetical protein